MSQEPPVLLVFAGPNGSGKSSVTNEAYKILNPSLYINADDIVKEKLKLAGLNMRSIDKVLFDRFNLDAAREADRQRQQAIKDRVSFATETVMSTTSKIDFMREAKANGYVVKLLYITTQDPNINIGRVHDRVEKGGHPVAPDKIKVRYGRAMGLLAEAIQTADTAIVYNNSFENPIRIFEKTMDKELHLYPRNPPDVRSKWTQEQLEIVKQNVIKIDNSFKAISAAPEIHKLEKSPTSNEKLYTTYAKAVMLKNQNVWYSQEADKEIIRMMAKDGRSLFRIRAALSYSPNIVSLGSADRLKKTKDMVLAITKEPEMAKFIKTRGLTR